MTHTTSTPLQSHSTPSRPIMLFLDAVRTAAARDCEASPENFWCDGERPRTAANERAWTKVLQEKQNADANVRTALDAIPAEQRAAAIKLADDIYVGIRGLLTNEQLDALELPDPA